MNWECSFHISFEFDFLQVCYYEHLGYAELGAKCFTQTLICLSDICKRQVVFLAQPFLMTSGVHILEVMRTDLTTATVTRVHEITR